MGQSTSTLQSSTAFPPVHAACPERGEGHSRNLFESYVGFF